MQGGRKAPRAGGLALGVLSRLLTVLRLLYMADAADYRVAIQRWFRRSSDRGAPRRRGRRCSFWGFRVEHFCGFCHARSYHWLLHPPRCSMV